MLEMLDGRQSMHRPTGGYLLTMCVASSVYVLLSSIRRDVTCCCFEKKRSAREWEQLRRSVQLCCAQYKGSLSMD